MGGPVAYQMPVRLELAQKVGPRMFRKTILKAGHISKGGTELDIDRPYLESLVSNFNAGLRESVTLQLADRLNRHNEDPERTRGRIVGLELTAGDELVGLFETSDDGAALLEKYPYIGCSVSIDPHFERADGRVAGPTLLHVAATTDPEVSQLGDWLALSSEYDQVIDLTAPPEAPTTAPPSPAAAQQQETDSATPGGDLPEGDPVASLTDEQISKLLKLIEGDGTAPVADAPTEEPVAAEAPETAEAPSDAEVAAQVDAVIEGSQPQLVNASAETSDAVLELTRSKDALEIKVARMQRQLDEERFVKERDDLARSHGVPPAVTELCKEWLTGSHRIELSSGKSANPGDAIRQALKMFAATGPLDLSGPTGSAVEAGADDEAKAAQARIHAAARAANFGM